MKSLNSLLLPIAAILLITSPFTASEDINSTVSSTATAKVSEPTSGTIPTTLSSTTIKREKPTPAINTVPTTSMTFRVETTTSLPPPLPSTSPLLSVSTSTPKPEGLSNVPCKSLNDCRSDKGLKCLEGLCRCEHPKVFDIRQQLCIIPLGAECNSELSDKESHCPEFAECFLDRCVCKTGYSMHTLTKCKSDVLDRKTVLWPKPKQDNSDKSSCTPASCDESKGLKCQDGGACKCKDSKEIFVEEFGRCLNTVMQKTLKDALALVSSSELDVKSFVKLLEKFDESDQATGASDNYSSPVHQLVSLLGGSENGKVLPGIKRSQADPYGFGDFYAAQEPVGESAFPDDGGEKLGGGEVGSSVSSPTQHSFPISPTHQENIEHLAYSRESGENLKKPETSQRNYLPLDNYQPQSQEPAIVQRQAPPFGGQHQQGHGGHRIPLDGFGGIPGGGGFGMPFGPGGLGHGLGGLGHGLGHHGFGPGLGHGLGHHGLGGHGLGSHGGHGLGHHELGGHPGGLGGGHGGGHQGGFGGHQGGGFGGGQGGFGGGQGGFGGGQGGFGGGQGGGFGGGQGGFGGGQGGGFGGGLQGGGFGGLGHGGGHQGGFGGHQGGLGHQGLGGAGGFGGGGFGGGGGGGLGGAHHGGHHGGHGHGLNKDGLLVDVAEFVGRSLKLIDRFLPLAHALNDVLKKDPHLQHKQDGGIIDGQRARRFGENGESSKEDLFKEGGILSGFTKFVGVLMRLKGRLETSGGNEPLKQLLL